jgi:predicted Zn finger-like uncharacterized protein
MPLTVACPGCKTRLQVPDNAAGKAVKCPKCAQVLKIGAPAAPAPTPAAAPAAPAPAPAAARAAPAPKARPDPGPDPNVKAAPGARSMPARKDDPDPNVKDAPGVRRKPPKADDDVISEAVDEGDGVISEAADDDGDVISEAAEKPKVYSGLQPLPEGADPYEGYDVPDDVQTHINKELTKKERVLWFGKPDPEVGMTGNAPIWVAYIVGPIFSAIGLGVGIFGSVMASGDMAWLTKLLCWGFGGLFLVMGVLVTLAPLFAKKMGGAMTLTSYYVLTSRRCLVVSNATGTLSTRSYGVSQLLKMHRDDSPKIEGAGSIVFVYINTPGGTGSYEGFLGLRDARRVYKLIREALLDTILDKAVR